MADFILPLFLMSAALFLSGALVLLFRKTLLRERERYAFGLIALVLVLSVLPIFAVFPAYSSVSGNVSDFTGGFRDFLSEKISTDDSHDGGKTEEEQGETSPEPMASGSENRRFLAGIEDIATLLFTLWLIGGVLTFLALTVPYCRFLWLVRRQTAPAEEERLYEILRSAEKKIGIKRHMRILVMQDSSVCPPFVSGIFRPVIWLNPATLEMPEEQLELVLAHELCHVKYGHRILKGIGVFVNAVHWFNPMAYLLNSAMSRDCECCCDAAVMKRYGEHRRRDYMETVLTIASAASAERRHFGNACISGSFFSDGTKGEIKRRFQNMKKSAMTRFCRVWIVLTVIAALSLSVVSAALVRSSALGATTGSPLLDSAIRAYNRLSESDPLTGKMLAEVTSLRITVDSFEYTDKNSGDYIPAYYDWKNESSLVVNVYINGDRYFGGALEFLIDAERFEEWLAEIDRAAVNDTDTDKFKAFYVIKDLNDPLLEPRAREEMLLTFPECADGAIYALDPTTSVRERNQLIAILGQCGLLESKLLPNGVLDGSAFLKLPNLTEVEFQGVTILNAPEGIVLTSLEEESE